MSPRTLCALLFSGGCIAAAAIVMMHGIVGLPFAFGALTIAWMAADRADPTKWSAS